jgi:hypothetical protein
VGFYLANGFGGSIDSPSREQMQAFLDDLDTSDEEHGAAWLATDDGYALEWNGDGRLVFEAPDIDRSRHLVGVDKERAIELWCALAHGDVARVQGEPWREGTGFTVDPERQAEMQRAQLESQREFYESLGEERSDVRCRRESCGRGAVANSVLCRVHHFESIQGRPCPFDH